MDVKEKINLLEVIPCHNERITTKQDGDTIVLSYPRFKHSCMNRFFLPKNLSKDIHVQLEEHGSIVWTLIDGKRTVSEIIEKLEDHFPDDSGYEARVVAYLTQMQKDQFIKFMIKE